MKLTKDQIWILEKNGYHWNGNCQVYWFVPMEHHGEAVYQWRMKKFNKYWTWDDVLEWIVTEKMSR